MSETNMKAAVRYFTRTGHTESVAEAIADGAGCAAEAIPAPLTERADVLFLGCAVYGGNADAAVTGYIDSLDGGLIGRVVLFSTSGMTDGVCPKVRERLEARGIAVAEETFSCMGAFGKLNPGHPDEGDVAAARAFAESTMKGEN